MYMSYGSIGQILGHEILHGFDSVTRELVPGETKWWTEESKEAFTAREECVLNQYGTGNALLYSKRTIRENIPDHGGIKLAYRAHRKSFSIITCTCSALDIHFLKFHIFCREKCCPKRRGKRTIYTRINEPTRR